MRRVSLITIFGFLSAVGISGCAGSPSTLDAHGPKGTDIAVLWWVMFVIAAVVCGVVTVLLLIATLRPRPAPATTGEDDRPGTGLVLWGGAIIPAILLVGLFFFVLRTMVAESAPARASQLTITVVGHRWWWEFRYPQSGVTTGNEMHVPVGQAVRLQITSADVIHSFWVPQIQEKTDAIPGTVNTTWFEASKPGINVGECAEYCGVQHANMDFIVVAQPPAQFQRWLTNQRRAAPVPKTALQEEGQQVFLGATCVYCHTIKGTNASGRIGPDLTHLMSRSTIGAGIRPNTPGNLAGWIANSQSIKPGNAMPPMNIDARDMQALLAYLETLK